MKFRLRFYHPYIAFLMLSPICHPGMTLPESAVQTLAAGKKLIILHTNDIQSHLLGYGPNTEYTPMTTGDDQTLGGLARLATALQREKAQAPGQTLILDGGDFLMGSLFHTVCREVSPELRLLAALGYDAVALGNHEFDFGPADLARVIRTAHRLDTAPVLLLANIRFSETDRGDDALARCYADSLVRRYTVLQRNGLRIGLFGILGKDAAEVSPFAKPVTFTDPIETAKEMATFLRTVENVDLVIALSHSGVRGADGTRIWTGEDIELARAVPAIDVVIGGHTHTLLLEPVMVGNTAVVQVGEHGKYLGVLEIEVDEAGAHVAGYRVVEINDSIPGDPNIHREIEKFKAAVNDSVLAGFGYRFDQIVAESAFDLTITESDANLGNLVTDAIRWGVERVEGQRVDIGIEANGQIREEILSGRQSVNDLFRPIGLGVGPLDRQPGYPLVKFYVTAADVKKALEVLTTVYPLKGWSYYLQVSGLRFRYNRKRVMFDRVVDIEIEEEGGRYVPLDLSESNHRLYSVATNYYVASFIAFIGQLTYGILDIVPRDASGQPIEQMRDALVDADPARVGVQELKEWWVFLEFIRTFPDTDDDGVVEIPERYRQPQGRIVALDSWQPSLLLKNATSVTWFALAVALLVALLVLWVGLWLVRRTVK